MFRFTYDWARQTHQNPTFRYSLQEKMVQRFIIPFGHKDSTKDHNFFSRERQTTHELKLDEYGETQMEDELQEEIDRQTNLRNLYGKPRPNQERK